MTRYRFDHWEDGSTTSTRTITVTSDMTIRATYVSIKRRVGYESEPIAVEARINTTPVSPGSVIEIEDGATITITVPSEVEV